MGVDEGALGGEGRLSWSQVAVVLNFLLEIHSIFQKLQFGSAEGWERKRWGA
jgi:hypothetical protein